MQAMQSSASRLTWHSPPKAVLQHCRRKHSSVREVKSSKESASSPQRLVSIENGTFYREYPSPSSLSSTNPALFPNLDFRYPAAVPGLIGKAYRSLHLAVISAQHTSTFLDVIRGNLFCQPISARTYPYLSSDAIAAKDNRLRIPQNAIQYVGFNNRNSSLGSSSGVTGAYLSARYESHREETDWTVRQYLTGATELNPDTQFSTVVQQDDELLQTTIKNLRMEKLLDLPVANLSNGQTRRARIAKALLTRPELLLLDEPFMGLDPPTLTTLSPMLGNLAKRATPLLILGLRPQDPIPDWISQLIVLGPNGTVQALGTKEKVLFKLHRWVEMNASVRRNDPDFRDKEARRWLEEMTRQHGEPLEVAGDVLTAKGVLSYDLYEKAVARKNEYFEGFYMKKDSLRPTGQQVWQASREKPAGQRTAQEWWSLTAQWPLLGLDRKITGLSAPDDDKNRVLSSSETKQQNISQPGEPLIELESVVLRYGSKTVLGHPPVQPGFSEPGLNLIIRRGTRLALLGPNGSGKTTLLSLLTSDHPQSYSLPIKFFGRDRLPIAGVPGLSLWEIQKRIGHSSPEVHAFFPKRMTIRACLENSWSETFGGKPQLDEQKRSKVDRMLRWWEDELRQNKRENAMSPGLNSLDNFPTEENRDVSWATDLNQNFGVLPVGTQRLLLLLRAFIKQPDILVLDEAFSGLSAEIRDKAMCFLEYGESKFVHKGQTVSSQKQAEDAIGGLTNRQGMVVVSHIREELPSSINEWIRLPSEEEAIELEKPVMMGEITGQGIRGAEEWNKIWGLGMSK